MTGQQKRGASESLLLRFLLRSPSRPSASASRSRLPLPPELLSSISVMRASNTCLIEEMCASAGGKAPCH